MKVKDLIKQLQLCDGNMEVVLRSNREEHPLEDGIPTYKASIVYAGNYNFAERDCAPGLFKNAGLDKNGKDLNAVLII